MSFSVPVLLRGLSHLYRSIQVRRRTHLSEIGFLDDSAHHESIRSKHPVCIFVVAVVVQQYPMMPIDCSIQHHTRSVCFLAIPFHGLLLSVERNREKTYA